jgi:hypothetical protein
MAPQDKKPKPVTTLRCSRIKASIWRNEGMNGPFYNVTVARSYKGQDGVLEEFRIVRSRRPRHAGLPSGRTADYHGKPPALRPWASCI